MKALTADQVRFFADQGYLVIDGFLSPGQVAALNAEIDRIVAERASLTADEGGFNLEKRGETPFNGEAKAAGIFRKIQSLCEISAPFREFAEGDALLDVMEDLCGPNLYFHSNKLMFKPARHGSAKPWHQDYAYWRRQCPEPNQVSAWLALEDATRENGCLQIIPASQELGLLDHHKEELQVALEQIDVARAVICEAPAGSLVLFHCLTLHYSAPNTSDRSRRGMIFTYGTTPECGRPVRVADQATA
ncbi:MAG: phytanoyl-CoA dioxygenase family protein [Armatimonadetes bacterium]|nr:phytanoyl-CoA dioxygenase family protein [Armatimonadota bacterium]